MALRIRGVDLLYDVLLALIPVVFLQTNFLKYLIPPMKIEPYLPRSKDSSLRLRE
jgi:hypothetical protein